LEERRERMWRSTDRLIQADAEATVEELAVKTRNDTLPERSNPFLPGDAHDRG
jgi:hypothetical protein